MCGGRMTEHAAVVVVVMLLRLLGGVCWCWWDCWCCGVGGGIGGRYD